MAYYNDKERSITLEFRERSVGERGPRTCMGVKIPGKNKNK